MAWFTTNNVSIAGIAAAVPKNKVEAASCTDRFDEKTIEKFVKTTGVKCVRKTLPEQTAGDLGYAAAENLLNNMKIDRSKIGLLVFVTLSPDYIRPATACILQERLWLPIDCACVDMGHGCSGFIYGNAIIGSMMMASDAELGLLIVAETVGKLAGNNDTNSMLLGDAGTAILYERTEGASYTTLLRTDGHRFKEVYVPSGGFRDPSPKQAEYTAEDGTTRSKYDLYMNGIGVFLFGSTDVVDAIDDYQNKTEKDINEYDAVFLHQASGKILQRLIKKYKLDPERVPLSLERYGNTSSAAIPLLLCDYYGNQHGEKQTVLACGFGTGLSWGVTSFEIEPKKILPVIETDESYVEGKMAD